MSGPYNWFGLLTLEDLLMGLSGTSVFLSVLGDGVGGAVSNV